MMRLTPSWTAALVLVTIGATIAGVRRFRNPPPDTLSNPAALAYPARSEDAVREITLQAGTTLWLTLDDSTGSATSRVDDRVRAHLTWAVVVDGVAALPVGSELQGTVTAAVRSARVKGRARLAFRFDRLQPADGPDTYTIRTSTITRTARGTMKKEALRVGIPAAAGAALGGAFGGGKGALIGTVVGAGAGAGYVVSGRGPEVTVRRGAPLSIRLLDPVTVHARVTTPGRTGQPSP